MISRLVCLSFILYAPFCLSRLIEHNLSIAYPRTMSVMHVTFLNSSSIGIWEYSNILIFEFTYMRIF